MGTTSTPLFTPNRSQDSIIFGFDYLTLIDFDNVYWASQPTAVQALFKLDPGQPQRRALADQLSAQGYFIDEVIMIWGDDPYMTQRARMASGYTELTAKNGKKGIVSVNPGDFPPFNPAPAPSPGPSFVSLVGIDSGVRYVNPASPYNGWEMFNMNPGTNNSTLNTGDQYKSDPRGTFVKIVNPTPFGAEIFFVLKP